MRPASHPMHVLLHREFGIDSFALDGDDTELGDQWMDRPRAAPVARR